MADRGGLLTSLLNDSSNLFRPISSSTPDPGVALEPTGQEVVADTECALTLLQLAQSSVSLYGCNDDMIDHKPDPEGSRTGEDLSYNKVPTPPMLNQSSVREDISMDHGYHYEEKPSTSVSVKRRWSGERKYVNSQYHDELVKRIRLDHNYYWTGYGEFKYKVTKMLPTETVDSLEACLNGLQESPKEKSAKANGPTKSSSPGSVQKLKVESTSPKSQGKLSASNKSPKEQQSNNSCNSFRPISSTENKDRFHNFNLLLNCLESQADAEVIQDFSISKKPDDNTVYRVGSPQEVLESLDLDESPQDEGDLTCSYCFKTFSKKRYLTKHIRRMHPAALGAERDTVYELCPYCKRKVVNRFSKKGSSHIDQCRELIENSKKTAKSPVVDTASCQFCGVRLKRHMLVKHLAQEHCVDSKEDAIKMAEEAASFPTISITYPRKYIIRDTLSGSSVEHYNPEDGVSEDPHMCQEYDCESPEPHPCDFNSSTHLISREHEMQSGDETNDHMHSRSNVSYDHILEWQASEDCENNTNKDNNVIQYMQSRVQNELSLPV